MDKKTKEKDFYFDKNGFVVFTREFLLKRGFCCKNKCLNCPYGKISKMKASSQT